MNTTPTRSIRFEGSCPFLLCLEQDAHNHPVCEDCDTVNYGSLDCSTCRAKGGPYRRDLIAKFHRGHP
jgi:hypothetical protein